MGISQEVKAKRALDRLSLLVAPKAPGAPRRPGARVGVDEVVVGDLVLLEPGDQVVADGRVLSAAGPARWTSRSSPASRSSAARGAGDDLRSGAFVSEGTGAYEVTATGDDSFAARLTGEARSFRHPRSALEQAINRLLYVLTGAVVFLGAVLGFSLYHRHVALHNAVATSAAGVVSLIPEGLVLLVGVTYAAAAVRMSRRGVLAQQLNAIESLASVDIICVDKTGTLTEAVTARRRGGGRRRSQRGRGAGDAGRRGRQRIGAQHHAAGDRRRLPGRGRVAERRGAVRQPPALERSGAGPRDLLPRRSRTHRPSGRSARCPSSARQTAGGCWPWPAAPAPLPADPQDEPPAGLEPLGLVVLAEELRPGVGDTVQFLLEEGVEIKVLSGDAPATVAAIARDVGIPVAGVHEGTEIPADVVERRAFAQNASVIGRISPEGKQAIIQTLSDEGRYVAMIGDGVNDVPALKAPAWPSPRAAGPRWRAACRTLCSSRAISACCRCSCPRAGEHCATFSA